MGLLSWLFPSPDDKLNRARASLAAGRFNDARRDALGLDLPGASDVVYEAEQGLARLNLEAARSWADAGDGERVAMHLELAERFGGSPAMREIEATAHYFESRQREQAAFQRAQAEADLKRLMEVDPRFHAEHGEGEIPLPDGISEDDADALKARLAILHDSYPEALRASVFDLGAAFSQAVLDLDDGQPAEAFAVLSQLPDDVAVVQHERARALLALRDASGAVEALQRFAVLAGGHQAIGNLHTAAILSQTLAQLGRIDEAFEVLVEARRADPDLAPGLYAALLEARGDYAGAEIILRALLQKIGPQAPIYVAIARLRVAAGKRVEAMQALETGLRACGCAPGTCGSKPPDLAAHRMLATLYLEDGIETPRALEVAELAFGLVQQQTWDDLYLATLVANATQDPTRADKARQLASVTPPGDPRRARLDAIAAA